MNANCNCSYLRPEESEYSCNICGGALCKECLKDPKKRDIEDQTDREHGLCPDPNSSNSSGIKGDDVNDDDGKDKADIDETKSDDVNDEDEKDDTDIDPETPKRKPIKDVNEETKSTRAARRKVPQSSSKNEETHVKKKVPSTPKGKRAVPQHLKESVSNKDRSQVGFNVEEESEIKSSHRPSYMAQRRVMNGTVKSCATNFARFLKTRADYPDTKLRVSYQFKAKVTNEEGETVHHLFELGDVKSFDDENIKYNNLSITPALSREIKNLSKKTAVKNTKKKKESLKKSSSDETARATIKKKDEKKKSRKRKSSSDETDPCEDISDNSDETPKKKASSIAKKRRTETPPSIQVTPVHCIRGPFSRNSGQGLSIQKPPAKEAKKKQTKNPQEKKKKVAPKVLPKNLKEKQTVPKDTETVPTVPEDTETVPTVPEDAETIDESIPGPSSEKTLDEPMPGPSSKKTLGLAKRGRGRPKKGLN